MAQEDQAILDYSENGQEYYDDNGDDGECDEQEEGYQEDDDEGDVEIGEEIELASLIEYGKSFGWGFPSLTILLFLTRLMLDYGLL